MSNGSVKSGRGRKKKEVIKEKDLQAAILGEEYIILNLLSRNLNSAAKFDFRFIFLYHE